MSAGYEKKDVSIRSLAIGIAGIVILIVVFLVFLRGYFVINYEKSLVQERIDNPPQELNEILEKDKKLLSNYSVLDVDKGIYQIPIDRAMDLVVKDYKSRQ
jgi:hypothetical protein